ncbi:uncharacterized protein J4E79_007441 [Alternaria viburni]|uniref:uncharacterized protein n=1 Tax=Alternaria viburni TaxID=566460 RepID=UPI0020C28D4F|nr:uncharacterized protein J4E79_007441 [Alternaria viburni]KAI4657368.1 hypothetical protein J4E79_007441 [Alternaria viburni]
MPFLPKYLRRGDSSQQRGRPEPRTSRPGRPSTERTSDEHKSKKRRRVGSPSPVREATPVTQTSDDLPEIGGIEDWVEDAITHEGGEEAPPIEPQNATALLDKAIIDAISSDQPAVDELDLTEPAPNAVDVNALFQEMMADPLQLYPGNASAEPANLPDASLMMSMAQAAMNVDEVEFMGVGEEETRADFAATPASDSTMAPPQLGQATAMHDPSEPVPHVQRDFTMSPFMTAFSALCDHNNMSRSMYEELRSVLMLLDPLPAEIKALPKRVETLKESLRSQLPAVPMRSRILELDRSQLPTRATHTEKMLLFDMKELFKCMLQSKSMRSSDRMFVGMGQFVDNPTELWHSPCWLGSVRTTSGQYAHLKDGSPIFPSDYIWWSTDRDSSQHLARVRLVGVDKTSTAKKRKTLGKIIIQASRVCTFEELGPDLQRFVHDDDAPAIEDYQTEFFYIEGDSGLVLTEDNVRSVEQSVHMDYGYGFKSPLPETLSYIRRDEKIVIRRVINPTKGIRALSLFPPHRAELELQKEGRSHFVEKFDKNKDEVVSLPMLCFIDAFGLYKNMYRSIKGVYLIMSFLDEVERSRKTNVVPLTLGPYASNWEDVVDSLMHMRDLDRGTTITLQFGTKQHMRMVDVFVCAPILAYTGDMLQQNENSGCKGPTGTYGCRRCYVPTEMKGDLDYDTTTNGRYYHSTLRIREQAKSLTQNARNKLFKDVGFSSSESAIYRISPSLDPLRSTPGDAAHSEFKGLSANMQTLLFHGILIKRFQSVFTELLQDIGAPPGWPQIPSPEFHVGSYNMQEHGRASIIFPVLLRIWLEDSFVEPNYLKAIKELVGTRLSRPITGVEAIVHCFAAFARSNSILVSPAMKRKDKEALHGVLIDGRRAYQDLMRAAANASMSKRDARFGSPAPGGPGSKRKAKSSTTQAARRSSLRQTTLASNVEASRPSQSPAPSPIASREASPVLSEIVAPSDGVSVAAASDDQRALIQAAGPTRQERDAMAMQRTITTYMNSIALPNVHTGLHFFDWVAEYGSARNVLTFLGEYKHSDFKTYITKTNHHNASATLMQHEQRLITMQFLLSGAFESTDPDLTKTLRIINEKCPKLFAHLGAVQQAGHNLDEDVQASLGIEADDGHQTPLVFKRVGTKVVKDREDNLLHIHRPQDMHMTHPFINLLVKAYSKDYNIKNLTELGKGSLQYCEQFSFLPRKAKRRVQFKVNNFIRVRDTRIARIDGVCVHELHSVQRLFAIVTLVKGEFPDMGVLQAAETEPIDPLLQLPILKMGKKRTIVGLPNIHKDRMWIVPNVKDNNMLYVPWDIYFM